MKHGLAIFWVFGLLICCGAGDAGQKKQEATYSGKTLQQWITILNNAKDSKERYSAAFVLYSKVDPKKIGPAGKQLIPAFIKALHDEYAPVRRMAAGGLQHFGPDAAGAVPALRTALSDKDGGVRANAVDAIGIIGPPAKEAVPDLIRTVQDDDPIIRWSVARALGKIGPEAKAAVQALIKSLSHKNDGDRNSAALALGRIGASAKAAVSTLRRLEKNDPVRDVRKSAGWALKKIEAK